MEPIHIIISIILVVAIIASLATVAAYRSNFDEIKVGMTYHEVVSIVGAPEESSSSGNIRSCVWRKHVYRGHKIKRTITFKNDKVLHITED